MSSNSTTLRWSLSAVPPLSSQWSPIESAFLAQHQPVCSPGSNTRTVCSVTNPPLLHGGFSNYGYTPKCFHKIYCKNRFHARFFLCSRNLNTSSRCCKVSRRTDTYSCSCRTDTASNQASSSSSVRKSSDRTLFSLSMCLSTVFEHSK